MTREEFEKLCQSAQNLTFLLEECDSSDEAIYADLIDCRNTLMNTVHYVMNSVANKTYYNEYVKITKEVLKTDFWELKGA